MKTAVIHLSKKQYFFDTIKHVLLENCLDNYQFSTRVWHQLKAGVFSFVWELSSHKRHAVHLEYRMGDQNQIFFCSVAHAS